MSDGGKNTKTQRAQRHKGHKDTKGTKTQRRPPLNKFLMAAFFVSLCPLCLCVFTLSGHGTLRKQLHDVVRQAIVEKLLESPRELRALNVSFGEGDLVFR